MGKVYSVHPVYGFEHHHIATLLKPFQPKRVIDIGGRGTLAHYINCKVHDANIRHGIDGTKLPYKVDTFDAAVSIATLEHVKDQLAFLRESIRVARVFVAHWFPYGEGAEKAEKLKAEIGHGWYHHNAKLPSKEVIERILSELRDGKLYPLMSVTEHLLLMATRHPRMNCRKLYDYIYDNYALAEPFGYVLQGRLR